MNPEMSYEAHIDGRVYKRKRRSAAEQLVSELGGKLYRVTKTYEALTGWEWVDWNRGCPGPCRHWKLLLDGEFVCTINTDNEGKLWYIHDEAGRQLSGSGFPDRVQAMQAAENAYEKS